MIDSVLRLDSHFWARTVAFIEEGLGFGMYIHSSPNLEDWGTLGYDPRATDREEGRREARGSDALNDLHGPPILKNGPPKNVFQNVFQTILSRRKMFIS